MSDKHPYYESVGTMIHGYVVCALWSSTDTINDEESVPLDRDFNVNDFATEAQNRIKIDCEAFCRKVKDAKVNFPEGVDMCQVGHDFWLTRNSHGAGFWDRPELYGGQRIADQLSDIAHSFGELNPYAGDDGKIYFM